MIAPQGVGLRAIVQVVFVQLLAGGEVQRRAPDALGLDALFQPISAFGEGTVSFQTVGNPAQLTPGNGQKLRRRGIAADDDGVPALFQPGDDSGAQGLVHIRGLAL